MIIGFFFLFDSLAYDCPKFRIIAYFCFCFRLLLFDELNVVHMQMFLSMTQCGQRASSTLEFSHYVSTFLAAALDARRDKPGLISILFLQLEILHLATVRLYPPFFDASCVTPNTHRPRKPLGLFGALFGRLETTRTSFRYRLCVFYFRIFNRGPNTHLLGRELDYTRSELTVGTRRLSPLFGIIFNLFLTHFYSILLSWQQTQIVITSLQTLSLAIPRLIPSYIRTSGPASFVSFHLLYSILRHSCSFVFSQGIPGTRSLLATMVMAR